MAHFVGQRSRRDNAHSLGAHNRNVEAFGDLRRLQEFGKTFLLDEKHGTKVSARTIDFDLDLTDTGFLNRGVMVFC